jgi:hypothetical protein
MGVDHLWTPGQVDRQFEAFTSNEEAFIAARDSFYMASVSEAGWPYVAGRHEHDSLRPSKMTRVGAGNDSAGRRRHCDGLLVRCRAAT